MGAGLDGQGPGRSHRRRLADRGNRGEHRLRSRLGRRRGGFGGHRGVNRLGDKSGFLLGGRFRLSVRFQSQLLGGDRDGLVHGSHVRRCELGGPRLGLHVGLRLCLGLAPAQMSGQQLVGGGDPGLAVEEALLFLRGRGGLAALADKRAVVHGDVDVHLRPAGEAGGRRGMGGGLLLLLHLTAAAGALRLIFILGAVEEPLGHVHDGAVAGVQGQEEATEDADDGAAQLGEQADKDLAQQAAQGAAGLQLLAGGPQGLNKRGVPGQDLAEQPVKHH